MYLKESIPISEIECGECEKRFYEIKRRPLNNCPHCKEEMTFLNSHSISDKYIGVQINVLTGEARMEENNRGNKRN